ncbi:MAG: Flp pilus assembly complex ATPase component TadA, partial [Candidatus Omnitrophica bacterium]|nr:Flp pilus assembly complex ATPase component TadA [Candidatus Omnitrophota bacterium]
TGHLVFSTLHTNDAASGITRLVDIGVEPYLISSSVEAFIAQRLIRTLCPECKQPDDSAPVELKELIAGDLKVKPFDIKLFKSKGCPNCNFTGFLGRIAIYEILLMDDEVKDLVMKKVPSTQIKKVAISKGMRTLRQDGWQKVISGLTTPEEVLKTVSAEENKQDKGYQAPDISPGDSSEKEGLPEEELHQRAFHRLNDKVSLHYKVFKGQNELLRRGLKPEQLTVTKNISAGGLLFVSAEPVTVGSILELTLELPDGSENIECFAKVVRTGEKEEGRLYDIAVYFLDISSANRTRLKKYVEILRKG